MSYTTVENRQQRKALIDQFLKNRETLKKRVEQEKVGKQTFQREVAAELQKPVVEQQQKLEEERQKKTDERQNALIVKLQESQEAITGKLDDQEAAMLQNLLLTQQQLLQLQQPAQQPALAAARATPTRQQQPRVELNPDVGLDLNLLQQSGYQPISTLTASPLKDLEALSKKIQRRLQSLGGRSKGRDFTEENRRELENLQKYNGALKLLIQGKKASIVPTPPAGRTGQGIKTKNPYKLTDEGKFGNLWINPHKLNELKLEAYKDEKKVLSRKADQDLIELLTKRYNTKKQYSEKSLKLFAKLIDLSGLPVNNRSIKYSAGRQRAGGAIQYYSSPDELVERLRLLVGSKQGGKVSVDIDNEIVNILDRLREDGVITKKEYEKISCSI